VSAALDDLDWKDEVRQAIESRVAFSPDALTGLEANLRFGPNETMETSRLRTSFGVAELDFCAAECGRAERRAESVWKRSAGEI